MQRERPPPFSLVSRSSSYFYELLSNESEDYSAVPGLIDTHLMRSTMQLRYRNSFGDLALIMQSLCRNVLTATNIQTLHLVFLQTPLVECSLAISNSIKAKHLCLVSIIQ